MLRSLTSTQEALLPVYRDKWIAIGLSTAPLDRVAARQAITLVYRAAKQGPPTQYVYAQSPLAAGIIHAWVSETARRARVRASVGASVGASVRASVGMSGYGSMEAPTLSFYDFFLSVGGLTCCAPLEGLFRLAHCCGWWIPYQDLVILQDRPVYIHRDHAGRLHDDQQEALRYPDGWGLWSWHGLRVSQRIIEHPETITLTEIRGTENVELRRVLIERYGWERYVEDTAARLLDVDTEPAGAPGLRALYATQTGEHVLICCCASTGRTYALDIPPTISTCHQAANWLAGTENLALLVRT